METKKLSQTTFHKRKCVSNKIGICFHLAQLIEPAKILEL